MHKVGIYQRDAVLFKRPRYDVDVSLIQEPIFIWMSQFAYEPITVYIALVSMMLLSSVGLPLPEEVTLLSVGLLAYFGSHPHLFPPPYPGAAVVRTEVAMIVATIAVFGSDFLVYLVGRIWGRSLLRRPWMHKVFPDYAQKKIESWTHKYGAYTCGLFRFTPGLRFPGHLAYGLMQYPIWKFLVIDGLAVLVSVPTQIYLMATYGESILIYLKQFKYVVLGIVFAVGLLFLVRKFFFKSKLQQQSQLVK